MMLKRKSSQSKPSAWSLLRAGLAGLAVMVGGAAVTAGCLDRPVSPAAPKTSNVYVDEIRQTAVDKIDLLFMIDNSISMADKQAILAEAVPLLVTRLITPICVKPCTGNNCTDAQVKDGIPTGENADANGTCNGSSPEFNPIKDIHVGVITSSLGSHGAAGAHDVCIGVADDDHAHLLGDIRNTRDMVMPALKPYDANGFLKWDPKGKYNPPGDKDGAAFTTKFTDMVTSSGEHGCGYEASLEAWYRFLIDPEPPASVVKSGNTAAVMGVDGTVIAQRAAFLRPDSLVAIVMLSDENDCSIQDGGYGYLIASASPMFRSTSQCAANPNDKCCQSCGESTPNAGCPAIASDSECTKSQTLASADDAPNLRCYQQKRRFGFDLLYPTARYAEGLRSPVVVQRSTNTLVANPLFVAADGKPPRDKGLVFLAGIVGVPWQDIADKDSLTGDGLRYLTEGQMESAGTWDLILGKTNVGTNDAPVPPTDPLMIETPNERMGTNPVTMDAIVPSTSMNPRANKINGHEQTNVGNTDLQYACIFPLSKAIACDAAAQAADKGCDCFADDAAFNRPLCQPPGGGAAGTTQSFAKAYPGTRHLEVLKQFKDNSIVASICPKIVDDKTKADYGYNPAVKAIIDRLKDALKGKCLPRPLVPASEMRAGLEVGQVPCAVIEAVLPQGGAACNCDATHHRTALDGTNGTEKRPQLRDAVLQKLRSDKVCDITGGNACTDYCTCELDQLAGADLTSCQNDDPPPAVEGYCYVNDAPNEPHVGNTKKAQGIDLVKSCADDSKRLLRFVGGTPAAGAIALVACLGASLGSTPAASTMP
jgi:hypothetical protein